MSKREISQATGYLLTGCVTGCVIFLVYYLIDRDFWANGATILSAIVKYWLLHWTHSRSRAGSITVGSTKAALRDMQVVIVQLGTRSVTDVKARPV